MQATNNPELVQGSVEWLDLRKKHITGTDAVIIMNASHWKTKVQLYHEKISPEHKTFTNATMQRGIDLEPIARGLFSIKTGIEVYPHVIIKEWAMASLDGISADSETIVEIKCPGEKDHAIALSGKVPDHYFPQLQHQMYVAGVQSMYYFSFDGADGVIVEVARDDAYIEKMIEEELKFYECLQKKSPPEPEPDDYVERDDDLWKQAVDEWIAVKCNLTNYERQEEQLRKKLIFLAGESNAKGAGISLCQVNRKGNIDYAKIPELKNIDLEKYRKETSSSWRISCL
jgi:putative phage-type endonuclease